MSDKSTNPKGTKDYGPIELLSRRFIINTIRNVFISFGYSEIETPSIEKRLTLYEKYGEEGDRFIFNIINSGDKVKKADINALSSGKLNQFVSSISEKGLRFDLTVPLARFVAQHFNEISFPFKRFQIQKVWRSDRPQRGRLQEFTQCDADVIGSDSLFLEYEMIQIYSKIFKKLGLKDVIIKVNHREILNSIANKIGLIDKFSEFIILVDKKDKIGVEKLRDLLKKDLNKTPIDTAVAGRLYQMETITRVCERFSDKHRKALIVQATGTGKTRVSIALAKRLLDAGWAKRVLFLCDRKELRKQAGNAFTEFTKEPVHIVGKSAKNTAASARVFIATYPGMLRIMNKYDVGYFDLIVADESHRSIYNIYGDIFKYFEAKRYKNVSCNNYLGVREGQLLPEVKDFMFHNKGWDDDVKVDNYKNLSTKNYDELYNNRTMNYT